MKWDKTKGWIAHDGTWIGRDHPLGRKLLRKERIARATRAGIATGVVGSGVAAGALTGIAAIGAKRDRDYKKKLAAKKVMPVAKSRSDMPGYPRAWDGLPDDSPEGFALRRRIAAENAKAARRARLVRAGRAGAKAGVVGGAAATGALAGSVIGSKLNRKKGGKKKMGSVVEKNLGLFARPMTMRRAQAAGRLARVKAGNARSAARGVWADRGEIAGNVGQLAGIRGARAAGQAKRYVTANAMPLVVGGSIGGGATMAAMQMSERRKNMSKSDAAYVYVTGRLSKGLPSALRPARGKLVPAMRNPGVRARVEANTMGRASGFYRSRGMGADAAQRTRMGQVSRFNSSGTFRRAGA